MLIRAFNPDDLSFGTQLLDHKGRGFQPLEYQSLIRMEPTGCFTAEEDGQPVGMITSVAYGKLGWIGNLIVHSDYRRLGCGRALLDRAINCLLDRGVRTVGLDATLRSVPFYTRAGFWAAYELLHLRRDGLPAPEPIADSLAPLEAKNLHTVAMFDWPCFGGCRKRVLRSILQHSPVALQSADQDGIAGYLMARPSHQDWIIGPWVCVRSAEPLLTAALARIGPQPARVAIPQTNGDALGLLRRHGFRIYYREVRMYWGDQEGIGRPQHVYAIASPEKG